MPNCIDKLTAKPLENSRRRYYINLYNRFTKSRRLYHLVKREAILATNDWLQNPSKVISEISTTTNVNTSNDTIAQHSVSDNDSAFIYNVSSFSSISMLRHAKQAELTQLVGCNNKIIESCINDVKRSDLKPKQKCALSKPNGVCPNSKIPFSALRLQLAKENIENCSNACEIAMNSKSGDLQNRDLKRATVSELVQVNSNEESSNQKAIAVDFVKSCKRSTKHPKNSGDTFLPTVYWNQNNGVSTSSKIQTTGNHTKDIKIKSFFEMFLSHSEAASEKSSSKTCISNFIVSNFTPNVILTSYDSTLPSLSLKGRSTVDVVNEFAQMLVLFLKNINLYKSSKRRHLNVDFWKEKRYFTKSKKRKHFFGGQTLNDNFSKMPMINTSGVTSPWFSTLSKIVENNNNAIPCDGIHHKDVNLPVLMEQSEKHIVLKVPKFGNCPPEMNIQLFKGKTGQVLARFIDKCIDSLESEVGEKHAKPLPTQQLCNNDGTVTVISENINQSSLDDINSGKQMVENFIDNQEHCQNILKKPNVKTQHLGDICDLPNRYEMRNKVCSNGNEICVRGHVCTNKPVKQRDSMQHSFQCHGLNYQYNHPCQVLVPEPCIYKMPNCCFNQNDSKCPVDFENHANIKISPSCNCSAYAERSECHMCIPSCLSATGLQQQHCCHAALCKHGKISIGLDTGINTMCYCEHNKLNNPYLSQQCGKSKHVNKHSSNHCHHDKMLYQTHHRKGSHNRDMCIKNHSTYDSYPFLREIKDTTPNSMTIVFDSICNEYEKTKSLKKLLDKWDNDTSNFDCHKRNSRHEHSRKSEANHKSRSLLKVSPSMNPKLSDIYKCLSDIRTQLA